MALTEVCQRSAEAPRCGWSRDIIIMEVGMKNRQVRLAKVLSLLVMGTLTLMMFSSSALAQQSQWMKDAHQMMADGWKQFNDGQRQVIQGKEMNDQVA
jgi:hypothetical protein